MTDEVDVERDEAAPAPRGISPNALILAAACVALGVALAVMRDPPGLLTFAFVLATWVLSVVVHEFAHAYVAYRAGDMSMLRRGYLTLDPLKYIHLSTSIVLPILVLIMGGIGFPGGAVYLREDLMRSRHGRALASLAGPGGTLAVLLVVALAILGASLAGAANALVPALALLALLEASALILNLLPVPGLDGYGVIRAYMPKALRRALAPVERFGFIAILALILFVPTATDVIFGAALALTDWLGVPRESIAAGWDAFHFWQASPTAGG